LTGERGTFGINKTEYTKWMRCGWKIKVDPSKVDIIKVRYV